MTQSLPPSSSPAGSSSQGCEITVYQAGDRILLVLQGYILSQNAPQIRDRLQQLMNDPSCHRLDLALGGVQFIDSTGLGVFVGFQVMARKQRIELRLLSPAPRLLELLQTTNLVSVFQILSGEPADELRRELERPELLLA